MSTFKKASQLNMNMIDGNLQTCNERLFLQAWHPQRDLDFSDGHIDIPDIK